jgi:hypothetical protein
VSPTVEIFSGQLRLLNITNLLEVAPLWNSPAEAAFIGSLSDEQQDLAVGASLGNLMVVVNPLLLWKQNSTQYDLLHG